jgi:hypothetical protein
MDPGNKCRDDPGINRWSLDNYLWGGVAQRARSARARLRACSARRSAAARAMAPSCCMAGRQARHCAPGTRFPRSFHTRPTRQTQEAHDHQRLLPRHELFVGPEPADLH